MARTAETEKHKVILLTWRDVKCFLLRCLFLISIFNDRARPVNTETWS
jgi:hypothetical protein